MRVVLGFGSNIGDRKSIIEKAIKLLNNRLGTFVIASTIIESEPWGFVADNLFLNSVACFETELSPDEILAICLQTEKELGRIRIKSNNDSSKKKEYSSRTIDIDILLIDNIIINTPNLQVPHPLIQERDFVLNPLKEIIPNWIHPILNKEIKDIILENK